MCSNPPRIPAWCFRSDQLLRNCTTRAAHAWYSTLLAPGMEESGLVGVREQAGQPQYWAGTDGPQGAKKRSDSLHHYEIMINVGYKDVQNNPVQI